MDSLLSPKRGFIHCINHPKIKQLNNEKLEQPRLTPTSLKKFVPNVSQWFLKHQKFGCRTGMHCEDP